MTYQVGRSESSSLRQAAATIFALSSLLPLLLFLSLVWRFELVWKTEAQLGLLLAMLIALLGFALFQRMVDRISTLLDAVRTPNLAEQAVPLQAAEAATVPGLGRVAEIGRIVDAFGRLLEDLRGSTQRLEDLVFKLGTLNELTELVARIPAMQDLLGLVLERTMRAVGATVGSIMLVDQERQTLRIAAARGPSEQLPGDFEVNVGEGIAGKVAQLGEPVLVEDIERDSRFAKANRPKYRGGSFISVPVRVGARVIGVINLKKEHDAASTSRPFISTDLQFLNALMAQIAYALDNARLLEEARQSANQLEKVVEDLKAAGCQLVQAEKLRAVGQMAGGVAHNFNNLLAVVLGRAQFLLSHLEEGKAPLGEVRRNLAVIERAALNGTQTLRRLLEFTRDTARSEEAVAVNVEELLAHTIELSQHRWKDEAEARGCQIQVVLEPDNVPPIAGHPAELQEVLLSLVLNAIDAMPHGGTLTLSSWAEDSRVCLVVKDTGIGIPEQMRARIFDPFFTTKGPQSTGLGLSVCYGIVSRYQGEILVDSEPGQGTTFTVKLPSATAPAPQVEPPSVVADGKRLRILIVDDEAEVRAIFRDIAEGGGHEVSEAANGPEGLELLEGQPVDLVCTDLGMPGMTGWQVVDHVRARWPELTVALITGWGARVTPEELQAHAVDLLITKPFQAKALLRALAELGQRAIRAGPKTANSSEKL